MINKLSYAVQKVQQTYWDMPRDRLRRSSWAETQEAGRLLHHVAGRTDGDAARLFGGDLAGPRRLAAQQHHHRLLAARGQFGGWEPSAEFRRSSRQGEPPIYLGFGSMPFGAQRNTEIIVKALKLWGGRAVIGKGWGGVRPEQLPESVFVIDRAPHTKLFDHVKAVVHHGGAGTTHTGLYAGRPSFAVPQFFDQPYWGAPAL